MRNDEFSFMDMIRVIGRLNIGIMKRKTLRRLYDALKVGKGMSLRCTGKYLREVFGK